MSATNIKEFIQQESQTREHDYVTVIKSEYPINKRFVDGKKISAKAISRGIAQVVHVPDVEAMERVLKEISENEYQVIVLGYITEKIGEDHFYIVTEDCEDIDANCYARTKKNFRSSSWTLFDRDVTGDPRFDGLSTEQWFKEMDNLIPGFSLSAGILVPSNSNRVEGFESSGYHFITQVSCVDYLENAGKKILLTGWSKGYGIEKLSTAGHKLKRTIVDCSTFNPERVVYEGKPIAPGLKVKEQEFIIRKGGRLDLSILVFPEDIPKGFTRNGNSITQDGLLTWDTEIETEHYGRLTLKEIHDQYRSENKVRCQATFRESVSWNGFISWHQDETPFLFDNGTGVKYTLAIEPASISINDICDDLDELDQKFSAVLPDDVLFPDDCFGELVSEVYESMWRPNKMSAFLATDASIAYLSGGKYRGMNSSDTVNTYNMISGDSGIGKSVMIDAPTSIIDAVFFDDPEAMRVAQKGIASKLKTDAGVEDLFIVLGDRPDILFPWDEVGVALTRLSHNKQDWMATVLDLALELWPAAHKQRTKRNLAKDSGDSGKIIPGPHLNIAGATTETSLVNGINIDWVTSGRDQRFLTMPGDPYFEHPRRVIKELNLSNRLIRNIKDMFNPAKIPNTGNLSFMGSGKKRIVSPERILWNDDVADLFYQISCIEYKGLDRAIRNRAVLLVKKLAMHRASIVDPNRPRVSVSMAEWAHQLVNHSHDYRLHIFRNQVGEGVHDRVEKAVLRYMRAVTEKHDKKWVDQTTLLGLSQIRKLDTPKRIPILEYMAGGAGILEKATTKNRQGKYTVVYRIRPGYTKDVE